MSYPNPNKLPGTGIYADDVMAWRARQLLTAGYTAIEIVGWIGCPIEIAQAQEREVSQ